MTTKERLIYAVETEIDVYINLLQEGVITNPEARKFVSETVIPRFNKLREIVHNYPEQNYIEAEPIK